MDAAARANILFIGGCPRSGTTALWKLLVAHPVIVLGIERYVLLTYRNKLTPELFTRDKFFSLQAGETFYDNIDKFSPYYPKARLAFDAAQWVGDKLPNLYFSYSSLAKNFAGAHVFYILRNIIDVAGSYQKRAEDAGDNTWTEKRDFVAAVKDWNESIRATLQYMERAADKVTFHVISYEELFLSRVDIAPLFQALGLEGLAQPRAEYDGLVSASPQLEKKRGDSLTSTQRHYITRHADFESYRALYSRRLILEPLPAAPRSDAPPPNQGTL